MLGLTWLAGLFRRRRMRLAAQVLGVTLAVAMFASLGTFFASSRAQMTATAIAAVPVDWQVRLSPGADAATALATVTGTPGITVAAPVGFADIGGFRASAAGSVRTTGPGQVLGLPAGYASAFPGEIRDLVGAPDGVLLAQQTAANLGAGVGTAVTVERPGQAPARLTVTGIVDLPAADSLFQAIGVAPGSAPIAPPDNVMLLSDTVWHRLFAGAAPGTVTTQIHAQLARTLPPTRGSVPRRSWGERAETPKAARARQDPGRQQPRGPARRRPLRRDLRRAPLPVPRRARRGARGAPDVGRRGLLAHPAAAGAGAAADPRRVAPPDRAAGGDRGSATGVGRCRFAPDAAGEP